MSCYIWMSQHSGLSTAWKIPTAVHKSVFNPHSSLRGRFSFYSYKQKKVCGQAICYLVVAWTPELVGKGKHDFAGFLCHIGKPNRVELTTKAMALVLALSTYQFEAVISKRLKIHNKDRFRQKEISKQVTVCLKNVHRLERKNDIDSYRKKERNLKNKTK